MSTCFGARCSSILSHGQYKRLGAVGLAKGLVINVLFMSTNVHFQRLTVPSTILSRAVRCSLCLADVTRCQFLEPPPVHFPTLVSVGHSVCLLRADWLQDPRMAGPGMQRHHSVSEYDQMRSHSAANLQTYYANQRFQSRPSEAEQMMQSKRRMAAQRERELRNYHQEQQYNRSEPPPSA